jgi:hypothetical protein
MEILPDARMKTAPDVRSGRTTPVSALTAGRAKKNRSPTLELNI